MTVRYFNVFLCVLPFILLGMMFIKFSTNVPFMDQWALVPLLEKLHNGTLGFQDLWAQHNEHRIFFPKIIMLVLAKFTNWNIYFELAINIILGLLIYIIVLNSILNTKEITNPLIICFLSSLFIFSLVQWENWTWGWQIQIFLNVFAVYISLYAICLHNKVSYLTSVIFGFIATYSFANGILVWPMLLFLLAFNSSINKREKAKLILFFSIVFLLNVFLYYYGYHKPNHHPSLLYGIQHPFELIKYFLAYLGSPVGGFEGKISILCGGTGIVIYLVIACYILLKKNARTNGTLFWFSTALYPILSSAVSALGRSGFGYEQALSSRYTTISNMFWISLIILIFILVEYLKDFDLLPIELNWVSNFRIAFITAIIVIFAMHSNVSYQRWVDHYNNLYPLESELLTCNEANYTRSFIDANAMKSFLVTLSDLNLSLFSFKNKTIHEVSTSLSSGFVDLTRGDISETALSENGCLHLSGWVIDAERNVPVKEVVAAVNNEIIMSSPVNVERPDISAHFNNPKMILSGWTMEIKGQYLPQGESQISLYGKRDQNEYFKFGTVNITVIESKDLSSIEVVEFIERPDNILGYLDGVSFDGTYLSGSGWAISPFTGEPANEVIITDGNHRILAHTWVVNERPDVAEYFQDERKRKSGWSFKTQVSGIDLGEKVLAYVYIPEEKKAYKLENEFTLGS